MSGNTFTLHFHQAEGVRVFRPQPGQFPVSTRTKIPLADLGRNRQLNRKLRNPFGLNRSTPEVIGDLIAKQAIDPGLGAHAVTQCSGAGDRLQTGLLKNFLGLVGISDPGAHELEKFPASADERQCDSRRLNFLLLRNGRGRWHFPLGLRVPYIGFILNGRKGLG